MKEMDLNNCTVKEAEGVGLTPFEFTVPFPIDMSGYAGWFVCDFHGSKVNPVSRRVSLSTGPEAGYTHWGQQVFYLPDAIPCQMHTKLTGNLEMVRQQKNKRLYNVRINHRVDPSEKPEIDQNETDSDKFTFNAVYEVP